MKRGFTLIEIILSIFLFSIIMMFLFKATSNLKHNNTNFQKSISKDSQELKTIELLKKDLILANNKVKIINKDKDRTIITFQTRNSIYNISKPYVTWRVLKNSNKLIRVESKNKFTNENENYHLDTTKDNCKVFQVYKGKQGYLIYIKDKSNKEIISEVKSNI